MFSKIVLFSTLLAVAVALPGGIHPPNGPGNPAGTTLVAGPAPVVYAAAPAPIAYAAAPAQIVKTVAAAPAPAIPLAAPAPVAVAAPAVTYAAAPAPAVAIPAPVTYTTGVKVAHVYTPVEQHGYKIAY